MVQQSPGQFGQQREPQQGSPPQGELGAQQQLQGPFQLQHILGQQFAQYAPEHIAESVIALERLETVAEHAHARAMQQGNHRVGLIADGIEEIAHLTKELVVMESPLAPEMTRCAQRLFQQCIQQLQPQAQQPEVQELVTELQQTIQHVPQTVQQAMGDTGGSQLGSGNW